MCKQFVQNQNKKNLTGGGVRGRGGLRGHQLTPCKKLHGVGSEHVRTRIYQRAVFLFRGGGEGRMKTAFLTVSSAPVPLYKRQEKETTIYIYIEHGTTREVSAGKNPPPLNMADPLVPTLTPPICFGTSVSSQTDPRENVTLVPFHSRIG